MRHSFCISWSVSSLTFSTTQSMLRKFTCTEEMVANALIFGCHIVFVGTGDILRSMLPFNNVWYSNKRSIIPCETHRIVTKCAVSLSQNWHFSGSITRGQHRSIVYLRGCTKRNLISINYQNTVFSVRGARFTFYDDVKKRFKQLSPKRFINMRPVIVWRRLRNRRRLHGQLYKHCTPGWCRHVCVCVELFEQCDRNKQ